MRTSERRAEGGSGSQVAPSGPRCTGQTTLNRSVVAARGITLKEAGVCLRVESYGKPISRSLMKSTRDSPSSFLISRRLRKQLSSPHKTITSAALRTHSNKTVAFMSGRQSLHYPGEVKPEANRCKGQITPLQASAPSNHYAFRGLVS